MFTGQNIRRLAVWIGLIIAQLIGTQVVTFIGSFFLGEVEAFQTAHPLAFAIFMGITFSVGAFVPGWVAIHFHWLVLKPALLYRLAGTLLGAFLPLLLGLLISKVLLAGSPFFLFSILACILGFYLAGYYSKTPSLT